MTKTKNKVCQNPKPLGHQKGVIVTCEIISQAPALLHSTMNKAQERLKCNICGYEFENTILTDEKIV